MSLKLELLETIALQEQLISQQAKTIYRLVNENTEQESVINELMSDVAGHLDENAT